MEKIKTSATRTPGRQEFFYNKPLGEPLCLGALVAIFTARKLFFSFVYFACFAGRSILRNWE
jgi:hypothetical protein